MSLDDKLDRVLTDAQVIARAHDDVIADIKQAFADEGYLEHPISVQEAKNSRSRTKGSRIMNQEIQKWYETHWYCMVINGKHIGPHVYEYHL